MTLGRKIIILINLVLFTIYSYGAYSNFTTGKDYRPEIVAVLIYAIIIFLWCCGDGLYKEVPEDTFDFENEENNQS